MVLILVVCSFFFSCVNCVLVFLFVNGFSNCFDEFILFGILKYNLVVIGGIMVVGCRL